MSSFYRDTYYIHLMECLDIVELKNCLSLKLLNDGLIHQIAPLSFERYL